ncbi:MAG: M14 family metallopeptidase [Acidobacteriota bacterium]
MKRLGFTAFWLFLVVSAAGFSLGMDHSSYHTPEDVKGILTSWQDEHPGISELINIGKTSESRELMVFRLADEDSSLVPPENRPAVFISANLEGIHLVGTEAALMLTEKILSGYGSDEDMNRLLQTRTIYVAPVLNPDAASRYFAEVKFEQPWNMESVDLDNDGTADEDGPEDLNGDRWITQMRVKDAAGKYIPHPNNPCLMKKADPTKGEKGQYALYSEGIDNDGDGDINEDPPGGIELNRNFPHDFEYLDKRAGLWPVSAAENIALMEFLTDNPQIAMVLNFSTENTFLNLQQTGRTQAAGGKVKVPERYAEFLGLDPEEEYDLKELVEILKNMDLGIPLEIDESIVAMMLGLGPATDIDNQDRPYLQAVGEDYKKALEETEIDYPVNRAEGVKKGSFAAYCYFQYGVQVFSSDLWQVPEPKKEEDEGLSIDKLKEMSSREFLALGEEKIQAFLRELGAPDKFNASAVIKMVESGKMTPERMAMMIEQMPRPDSGDGDEHPEAYILKWAESNLNGEGFVDWTSFDHPDLEEVEIGGFVPYLKVIPPPEQMEKTLNMHTDFYIGLMKKMADFQIHEVKVKILERGLYKVEAEFINKGWFPTSTSQGRRARTAWPIRVELDLKDNQYVFSGKRIVTIPSINGSGDIRKTEWTIRAPEGSKITLRAGAPKIGFLSRTIELR